MADITGIPALKQGSRFLELGDAVLALASSLVCVWTVSFAISSLARGIDGVLTVLFVIIIALFNWRVRMWLRWKREELADFLDATDSFMFGAAFASILNNLQMLWYAPGPLLPDLGFALIPEVHPGDPLYILSDVMSDILVPFLLAYAMFFVETTHARFEQCRVVFMRLAVVQWLRGLVVIGTSLPGPALHCRAGPHYRADIPASATMVLTQQGQILGLVKSCGDLIYSGQSATLMVLLITLYPRMCAGRSLLVRRALKVGMTLYALLFAALVVACRKHYSVDVTAGFVVAWVVRDRFDGAPAWIRTRRSWAWWKQWWKEGRRSGAVVEVGSRSGRPLPSALCLPGVTPRRSQRPGRMRGDSSL